MDNEIFKNWWRNIKNPLENVWVVNPSTTMSTNTEYYNTNTTVKIEKQVICQNCGEKVNKNWIYCPYCGAVINQNEKFK